MPKQPPPAPLPSIPSPARSLVLLAAHAQRLRSQVQVLRAERQQLQQDLLLTRQALSQAQDAQGRHEARLRAANEHLLLAALQSQNEAERAAQALQAAQQASQRDPLTDTPNRALMLDRLSGAITLAGRRGQWLAVLFLDLDKFKLINDRLGHAAGDLVLQTVARRLGACVRQSDTVSRHGGDEFLILLSELARPEHAQLMARKMLAALAPACPVGPLSLRLSVSLGIALFPRDAQDAATLIACADQAMYRAKALGGGRLVAYKDLA